MTLCRAFCYGAAVLLSSVAQISAAADTASGQFRSENKSVFLVPLAFTQNQGQWPESVLFRAAQGGSTLWFSRTAVYQSFVKRGVGKDADDGVQDVAVSTIKKEFVGSLAAGQSSGESQLEYRCNYLIGNDPDRWFTNVPTYSRIHLYEVYAGVDITYYGTGTHLEYDLTVHPGGDYHAIKFSYENAQSVEVTAIGDLCIHSKSGELRERLPHIYQQINGFRKELKGSFVLRSDNTVGFDVEDYTPEFALVIDPILEFSSYLGGDDQRPFPFMPSPEIGHGVASDDNGYLYVVGETWSANFPLQNPIKGSISSIDWDGFVTKMNPSTSSLVYSTYFGGDRMDGAYAIAVDASGSAYITGETNSNDFPLINSVQPKNGYDVFVTKLAPDGASYSFSSLLGGGPNGVNGLEYGTCIAVDATGHAYVGGKTFLSNFPVVNGIQSSLGGNTSVSDCFIAEFSPGGAPLVFSTYLGGNRDDFAQGITVDQSSNIYVCGETQSHDFPTVNAYQPSMMTLADNTDAFLAKLNPGGSSAIYVTYLGGTGGESSCGVGADNTGAAYIAGQTYSGDFPTINAMDPVLGGSADAFLAKFNPSGSALDFSTFFGGSDYDGALKLAVDPFGFSHIWGMTGSLDFPLVRPFQSSFSGSGDGFVTKINPVGNQVLYSTLLGGSGTDLQLSGAVVTNGALALDKAGSVYISGTTNSADFPMALPYDGSLTGIGDAFVAKISCCVGTTGNVNESIGEIPDLSDLAALVAYLTLTPRPPLPCPGESNINTVGGIDLSDLSLLINFLTALPRPVLPNCP